MITINYRDPRPIYEQIQAELRRLMLTGALPPGSRLPSVRELAGQLAINPNTIQRAYNDLDARGILCAVPGRGCFITAHAAQLLEERARKRLPELDALVRALALAGVSREELAAHIDAVYAEEEKP